MAAGPVREAIGQTADAARRAADLTPILLLTEHAGVWTTIYFVSMVAQLGTEVFLIREAEKPSPRAYSSAASVLALTSFAATALCLAAAAGRTDLLQDEHIAAQQAACSKQKAPRQRPEPAATHGSERDR